MKEISLKPMSKELAHQFYKEFVPDPDLYQNKTRISMINDSFKNQGYGTATEKLILQYAFEQMGMQTVYADSLITNLRSQHVLQKVGFTEIRRDAQFVYYQCDKSLDQPEAL